MPSGTPWWPSPARTIASIARKRMALASRSVDGPDIVVTSAEPGLDARRQRGAADAIAVVQCRQGAGVEERIGQTGELEAGRLDPVPEQRRRDRLAEAADHRVILGDDDQ